MLKHIVFFKFKDKTDASKAKLMLEDLIGKVPTLKSMEVGLDTMSTPRSWDMSLIATFDNIEGYHEYDQHPEHLSVRKFIQSVREDSAAVDYDF